MIRVHHRAGPGPKRRAGLSLIEVLLGLTIGAILLTSVATAIQAGLRTENVNRHYARNIQMARTTLYSLVTAIRTASSVDIENGTPTNRGKRGQNLFILPPDVAGQPAVPVAYRWDTTSKALVKYQNAADKSANPKKGQVTNRLQDVEFKTHANDAGEVTMVTIKLVIGEDDTNRVTLVATAAPRCFATAY
jgi:prepilin-type N-terminal cleavage/methylation domain-containing protein